MGTGGGSTSYAGRNGRLSDEQTDESVSNGCAAQVDMLTAGGGLVEGSTGSRECRLRFCQVSRWKSGIWDRKWFRCRGGCGRDVRIAGSSSVGCCGRVCGYGEPSEGSSVDLSSREFAAETASERANEHA